MAFADFSTNNFQLTAFGNAQISTSVKKYGDGSALFDGSGDKILTTITDWNCGLNSEPFTIELWVYVIGSGLQLLVSKHGGVDGWNSTNGLSIQLFVTDSNLFFGWYTDIDYSGNHAWSISNPAIPKNQWVHIAVVFDGTITSAFVNGVQQPATSNKPYGLVSQANTFELGSQVGNYSFNGYIDDLRITKGIARYTSNFTPPQTQLPTTTDPYYSNVSLLLPMNLGPFTDSSTNNFELTAFGNADLSTVVKKYGTASGYFDGTGDYLRFVDLDAFKFGNQDFTVEFWIRPNSNPAPSSGLGTMISTGHPDANDEQGIFLGITSSRTLYWLYSNGGGWTSPSGSQPSTVISNSAWTHIAYVRSGNNGYLFADGQQVSSGSITGSLTNTGNNIVIGGRFTAANQDYAGYIDDLRITKGVARYTSNFTPPQQQLPKPSDPYADNVSLLLHMDNNQFVDASYNNFTITPFGNARSSTEVVKYGDTAAYFDGTGDYLSLPGSDAFNFYNTNYTIEMWVYSAASQTGGGLVSTRIGGVYSPWELQINSNNKIGLLIQSGGGSWYAPFGVAPIVGNITIPQNQWTHVAWVCNGPNTTVYVNGSADSGLSGLNVPILQSFAQSSNVYIGKGGDGDFNGYIDDLRITKGIARYTTTFTPPSAQLSTIEDPEFNNVSLLPRTNRPFTDSSSNNFTLSAFGDAQISTSTKKFGSGAGYFGGGTNRVTIQDNDAFTLNDAFTIEAWIYPTQWNSGPGGPYNHIISQSNNLANNNNRSWGLSVFSDKAAFYYTTDGVTDNIISFTTSISLSTWTHVAASITSNGTLRTFVNGTQVGTASISLPVFDSTADVCIGTFGKYAEDGYPDLSYTGYIDELRITKGIARYTSNFVPHTAPFVNPSRIPSDYLAFWKLADLTDSSPNGNNLVNTNNVQFVPGKIGNCAEFDGSNFLSTSNTFLLNQVTFSCWFKNTGSPSIGVGTGYPGHFRIVSIGGDVYFQTPDAVTTNTTGASLNDGNWHFCAGTSDGTISKLYIDGVLVDTSSVNYSPPSGRQFRIGSFEDGLAANGTQIDAVGIWNRELTQSEIDLLYNNGNGREP